MIMIVCKDCGNAATSRDDFCSSCGSLLEWSGQEIEATSAAGRADPVPRQPVPEAGRPRPVPLAAEPVYTGPYCTSCGVRNQEDRSFCRSCGEPLRGTAAAAARESWWRRLLARLGGGRRGDGYAAGDRPDSFRRHAVPHGARHHGLTAPDLAAVRHRPSLRRRRLSVGRLAPILLVAGLVGVGLGPARHWVTTEGFGLVHKARGTLNERYVSVVPVGASASSAVHRHGAALAVDGVQDTFWLSSSRHDGVGAELTVRFASPVNIDRIGLLSGEPAAAFRADARPQTIEVSTAGAAPVDISFDDTASFQNRAVSLHRVTTITFVFKDVYPGQNGRAVAVREVQFFARVSS
jgi:hypothetical protein